MSCVVSWAQRQVTQLGLGAYTEAISNYEEALRIRAKLLGEQHLDVGRSLYGLAQAHSRLGDYRRALELQKKVVEISLARLGEKHTDTGIAFYALGVLHRRLREFADAERELARALRIFKEVHGEQHPRTASAIQETGWLLLAASKGRDHGQPMLLVDGGAENFNGAVDELIKTGLLQRVLARTEITFSNSMIESWWRVLKHQWLYLNTLDTVRSVEKLVAFYVHEHNTRPPHSAFRGQTPDEMYFSTGGDVPTKLEAARKNARQARAEDNRQRTCSACELATVSVASVG